MKIVAAAYPLLFLASLSSSASTPSEYDALYNKCVDAEGTMNNGVVEACSGTVSTKAKKDISRRYLKIYAEHLKEEPEVAKKFEVSQKAWIQYRNSYCEFIFSTSGAPAVDFCHMRLNSARALELLELSGG